MDPPREQGVTQLLRLWEQGDHSALARLTEELYPQLRKIAANRLRGLSTGSTINPTELLHETWIRLVESHNLHFEHRASFYGAAAVIMRNVLVDRSRARKSEKRGGGNVALAGDLPIDVPAPDSSFDFDLEGIRKALESLENVCARQARQVDLRFFVGFSAEETAEVLGISSATLKRDWLAARMFIKDFIDGPK